MIVRREITIVLLLSSVLLFGGCAEKKAAPVQASAPPAQAGTSLGQTTADKTIASIATVERDIRAVTSQINTTNASLNQVIQLKGTLEGKRAFDEYSRNVLKMDKAAAVFLRDSDQMTARGTDYFREWTKFYSDPQLQKLSEERQSRLMDTFDKIAGPSTGVIERVNTYLSRTKEIETYLSSDLSASGIDAITPVAQKTIADGQQIIIDSKPMLAAAEQTRAQIGERGMATGGVSSPGY